jgi:hypothetical protein
MLIISDIVYILTGTTDNACDVTFQPAPTENEIQFILNEVRNYLHPDVEGILFCFILNMYKEIYKLLSFKLKTSSKIFSVIFLWHKK